MVAIQWKTLFQLVAILTICNCQEHNIKPDICQQIECCSSGCMTLSEYVLNTSNYNYNDSLILSPGEYYLNSIFSINGNRPQNFSILGSSSKSTTIVCTQNATFDISNLSIVAIKNVSFVSCGVDTVPGVSLTNINTVNLVDTSFSNSTSGALDIQNCSSVQLTDLLITNNFNSKNTIVHVNSSNNIILSSLLIANNSIGTLDSTCVYKNFPQANEMIFRIGFSYLEGSYLQGKDIQVLNNIGAFGILVVNNILRVTASEDWIFACNRVCSGGSLAFIKTPVVVLTGNLFFTENVGISDTTKHTAGLYLQESVFNVSGSVEFSGNEGYNACFMSSMSCLNISEGNLTIQNNSNSSFQAVSLQRESGLFIKGSFIANNNKFRQRIVLSESSEIAITGLSFENNHISPFSFFNSIVTLSGKLNFFNNSGIL